MNISTSLPINKTNSFVEINKNRTTIFFFSDKLLEIRLIDENGRRWDFLSFVQTSTKVQTLHSNDIQIVYHENDDSNYCNNDLQCDVGVGDRVVRARRWRRYEADFGQGVCGCVLKRRQWQRPAVHERRVRRPAAGERYGWRPRGHRWGRGSGHRTVWQRPVHGCVGLQELVVGTRPDYGRHRGVQRQSWIRPRGISR